MQPTLNSSGSDKQKRAMCAELCQSAEIMAQLQCVDMYIRVVGVGRGWGDLTKMP
jgi:hypothetical protein